MQWLGEEVLTLAANHVVQTVTTLGTDFAVALTQNFVDEVLLVRTQVQRRVHVLETSQSHAAANHVQVVQSTSEVACLCTSLCSNQVHFSQTDVRNTDEFVVHAVVSIVEHPLELAVVRSSIVGVRIAKVVLVEVHSAVHPSVGVCITCIVETSRQRLTRHEHCLIQTRVAVGEDVIAVRILAWSVDVRIRENATILHTEALHELVGRNGTTLAVAVEGETSPSPSPSVFYDSTVTNHVGHQLSRVDIENLLMTSLVVAIAVSTAVSHTVASFVLSLWLNQLVVVAVGSVVVEELIAILQAAVPKAWVFLAVPHILDSCEFSHLVR